MHSGKLKDGWNDEEGLSLSFVSGAGAVAGLTVMSVRWKSSSFDLASAKFLKSQHSSNILSTNTRGQS